MDGELPLDVKLIPLSRGFVAMVSDEDFERVSKFKWTAHHKSRGGSKLYATRKSKKGEPGWTDRASRCEISMHRFIMDPPEGMVVDHINGDTLDNRRENLEVVTPQENRERCGFQKRKSFPEIDF